MENGKIRRPQYNFTQVSNTLLRDENISPAAKGIYAVILSYLSIENFVVYKTTILKCSKCGKKAFSNYWSELKNAGYLKQFRIRDKEKNGFIYEYELLEKPDLSTPAVINVGINGEIIDKVKSDCKNTSNEAETEDPLPVQQKQDNEFFETKKKVEKNIDYDFWKQNRKTENLADNVRDLIVRVLCSKEKVLRIAGEKHDAEEVKSVFSEINYSDLEIFFDNLKKIPEIPTNPSAYFLSMLYNIKQTADLENFLNFAP